MKKGLYIFLIFCFSLTIISCGEDEEESTTDITAPVIAEVIVVLPPYVAVGDSGTFLKSTDGTTWTEITTYDAAYDNNTSIKVTFNDVTYGNSTFVTVGSSGTTSTDNTTTTSTTALVWDQGSWDSHNWQ